jgi:hypothetical protein
VTAWSLVAERKVFVRRPSVGLLVAALAAAAAVGVPVALALVAEQPVVATKLDELVPAADTSDDGTASYLSYARNSAANPKHYDLYLRTTRDGTTRVRKLNPPNTTGWGGGIDAPTVVYQQVGRSDSNIKLYDIDTRTRSNPPAGVNTARWEWHPTISDQWILFGRRKFSAPKADQIVLVNSLTDETRVLAESSHIGLAPGQVNGNWAVFDRCITLCNVFLYDITTETTTRLGRPTPDGDDPEEQYSASVTPEGVVYLIRSVDTCDAGASIVRYFGPGDPGTGTVIATVPPGRYFLTTFARANGDGTTDVFYDRFSCGSDKGDVYKVVDP